MSIFWFLFSVKNFVSVTVKNRVRVRVSSRVRVRVRVQGSRFVFGIGNLNQIRQVAARSFREIFHGK